MLNTFEIRPAVFILPYEASLTLEFAKPIQFYYRTIKKALDFSKAVHCHRRKTLQNDILISL